MTKKKYIGQLVSIKYSDRPTSIFGFVIAYNEDWTLLKYNPVDYIVDGYIICDTKILKDFGEMQKRSSERKLSC